MTSNDPEFPATERMTRLLQPFWDRLGAMQSEHPYASDATLLTALFEVPDSVLARIGLDDRRDLAALRLAIVDVLAANRVGGVGGGLTESGQAVIEAMGEEHEARGDVQRQEYLLLGLLRAGGPQIRGVLAAFGIDRERVLRELPPEVRAKPGPASTPSEEARGGVALLPALAHSSAIRFMDTVYERMRHGYAPSPAFLVVEITQLPYSPIARIAMERGFEREDVGDRVARASREADRDDPRREHNWSAECALVMATALGLWRGRGELLLDHFALALLDVGGERVAETLASLEVTADRIREGMPRLGADM